MKDERTRLFQYAAIYNPTEKEVKEGAKSKLVVEITTVLAKTEQEVVLRAAREIPQTYTENLNQIDIVVRPF